MFTNWSAARRSSFLLTAVGGAVLGALLISMWPSVSSSLLLTQGMDLEGRLESFEPHGHCYLWMKSLLWLHAASDFSIGTAYVAISATLVYLVARARKDVPFHWMFIAFGTFIIACGATHFMEVWITFFTPVYWMAGYIKLVTAIASVFTALVLPSIVPSALKIVEAAKVSNERREQLEVANHELEILYARSRENEAALQHTRDELEDRVIQRTAALAQANEELQRNGDRLRAIMDNTTAMIYLKDTQGRYLLLNRQFEKIFGSQHGDLTGKTAHNLFPSDIADVVSENDHQVWASDTPCMVDEQVMLDDGVHTYVTTKVALRDPQGKPYAICGISTDITEYKRTQNELQLAKEEAERANAAKSEFLSRISHELRTPLNAIIGFGQLLEMQRAQMKAQQKESVQHILKAGKHLLGLVNEVLDITRIETLESALSVEPVGVAEVVREAFDMVQILAVPNRISLSYSVPPAPLWVLADRQRLVQILLNLLTNAINYNKVEGRVSLQCEVLEAGRVAFHITDTGYGIAPAEMPNLFVPFARLGAESRGIEGTGLGLVLCQALVQSMKGSIQVQSEVEQGSTFSVNLPQAPNSVLPSAIVEVEHLSTPSNYDQTALPNEMIMTAPVPKTVMLIEDNASNFELIRTILENLSDFRLIGAMQGGQGIEMTLRERPDLILLDLHLPDMMGDEVLRHIQAIPEIQNIPVIVLSADATPAQIEKLLAQGARQYLTKPLDVKQFLQAVKDTI